MYDAIIIGARVAGSPLAMLLAKKGHRVLAVDRSTFPSDIMSTHYIQPDGVGRLQEWGLYDAVLATNCPSIPEIVFHREGTPMPTPKDDSLPDALCPRRIVLDKILVDAARAAGAEVREGFSVQEIIIEDGVVRGIRGRNAAGEILVFIATSPFRRDDPQYSRSVTVPLVRPTADTTVLVASAITGLRASYRKGFRYMKAGVMLVELQPHTMVQGELELPSPDEP